MPKKKIKVSGGRAFPGGVQAGITTVGRAILTKDTGQVR